MNAAVKTAVEELVRHLAAAVSTATLYPLEHAQVTALIDAARRELEKGVQEGGELSLMRLDEALVADGVPLGSGLYLQRFAWMLRDRGIGHLRIDRRVTTEELLSFAGSLAGKRTEGTEIRSTEYLRLGKVAVARSEEGLPEKDVLPAEGLSGIATEDLARLAEIFEQARRKENLHTTGISDIVSNFIRALTTDADPLLVLAPLRDMDEYTFAHSVNVCLLNLAQARSFGIEGPLLHDVGVAALLHDIGKLFVPLDILNKPGKLDEREWKIMWQHPAFGAKFLLSAKGVPRMAVLNAYEHHLKFDGSGYPDVEEHWQQNLCSQMTTLSDLVDAMLTRRSYREPLSFEKVAQTVRDCRGNHLHPLLADNFLRLLESSSSRSPASPPS